MEVELIWSTKFTTMSVLFILTRYLPFIDVPLSFYCAFAEHCVDSAANPNFAVKSGQHFLSLETCVELSRAPAGPSIRVLAVLYLIACFLQY